MSFPNVLRGQPAAIQLGLVALGVAASLLLGCFGGGGPGRIATPLASGACLPGSDPAELMSEAKDGPFAFDVGLYTDASLRTRNEASAPSSASDIKGVGWRTVWTYHGKEIGPVRTGYGPLDEIGKELATFSELLVGGTSDGHPRGGIVLPEDAKVGDRLGFGVRLQADGSNYAAGVFFTLTERAPGDFEACRVSVAKGWPLRDPLGR